MFSKKLTKQELAELREVYKMINQEQFKLQQVENNTALVHKAKDWVRTQKGVVNVLEQYKEGYISQAAKRLGMENRIRIDLQTGNIEEINESRNHKKDT